MEPLTTFEIITRILYQFLPVWISMLVVFLASISFKRKLGLYGRIFDSPIGMIGYGLVTFWVFTAFYAGFFDLIATHDPLAQLSGMKNKVPGTPLPRPEDGQYAYYLLGGDNLARDVFTRMVKGSAIVLAIAPLATLFGYIVGVTLGLPAGYYGGRLDTILSFMANLILAFPVILLFYLLVTPEIVATGIPSYMAAVFFVFPLIFITVLLNSRYHVLPKLRNRLLAIFLIIGIWVYLSTISEWGRGTLVDFWPSALDLFNIPGGVLVVFVSVVFVNSPTIFRIIRGLTLDLKSRDYVAAAQTRGESAWYIMLWEILPNTRGPADCRFLPAHRLHDNPSRNARLLRPRRASPESPDWGSTINEGRKLLSIYLHPALPPALALLSLVSGPEPAGRRPARRKSERLM